MQRYIDMQHLVQYYLRRIFSIPRSVLIKKIAAKTGEKIQAYYGQNRDRKLPSFALGLTLPCQPLNCLMTNLPQNVLSSDWTWLRDVTQHYLLHYFDILGSGWVRVHHGMDSRGLEGYRFDIGSPVEADRDGRWLDGRINAANLEEARRIWSLVDAGYCPIDWHLDFKSGYRWGETTWYKNINYGHLLGVDVKVPWELARMQHLPQLAWAYALAQRGVEGFNASEQYVREFRNQILDFIATNPPRWGVNWKCTMDIAIRVANWLVTYDLFRMFGARLDEEFDEVFSRSIYEHGRHIIENLEWSSELRSNHYLSDIAGLLFVSVYLPSNRETNAWLAFSVQQLIKEVRMQFYEDGGNFEASTSYHRLSAELVIYATALVLGVSSERQQALQDYDYNVIKGPPGLDPAPLPLYCLPNSEDVSPFPAWYFSRLERMAEFTMHITKPDGHIPQIGDNDSGRFLKLFPVYNRMLVGEAKAGYLNLKGYDELPDDDIYWMEDILNHRHLVAAINGLFARPDFEAFVRNAAGREGRIIETLTRYTQIVSAYAVGEKTAAQNMQVGDLSDWQRCENLFAECEPPPIVTRFSTDGAGLLDGLDIIAYPDFGLYLFRSTRLYLAIHCGSVGQNGIGGHAHNDQLSLELEIDGKPVLIDPGTYNYTALPGQRNVYRSVRTHFAPWVRNKEPGDLSIGAFAIGGNLQGKAIYFGLHGFVGKHEGYGNPVYRQVVVGDDAVVVRDCSPGNELAQHTKGRIPFSPAYGIIQNETGNRSEGVD